MMGATLLHGRDEGVLVPLAVHEAVRRLAVDQAEVEIGVLRRGVIAPDKHLADAGDVATALLRELRHRAIVIQPRHRGEIARVQFLGIGARDHGIGVGRVADHQHADIAVRHLVHRLALCRKDLGVGHQEVLALHAGAARARADQQRCLAILEGYFGVVGGDDLVERGEGAVIEFHHHTRELRQRRRDLEQVQVDRSIAAQHLSRGDAEGEGVADLAGRAGDGDIDCGFHRKLQYLVTWSRKNGPRF
jgi:hypothetical protein